MQETASSCICGSVSIGCDGVGGVGGGDGDGDGGGGGDGGDQFLRGCPFRLEKHSLLLRRPSTGLKKRMSLEILRNLL